MDLPTVELSATSCRFVFETQTSSKSTRISRPTPVRAMASAAHEPTPPTPTTIAEASRSVVVAASP